MSASLSKKVVGISRVANFLELKDVSDLKELSGQDKVHHYHLTKFFDIYFLTRPVRN